MPYGEADIVLKASVDFFHSLAFLNDMIRHRQLGKISYTLTAKLDAGIVYPVIRVTRKGKINL